jgi:hypothetical protein
MQLIDRNLSGRGGGGVGAALFIYLFIFVGMKLDISFWTVQFHLQFPLILLVSVPKVRKAGRWWEVCMLI